jgi:hypothetical protein
LTAAGYRQAIRSGLAGCGSVCSWRWTSVIDDAEQWRLSVKRCRRPPGKALPSASGGPWWCRFSTIRWRRIW